MKTIHKNPKHFDCIILADALRGLHKLPAGNMLWVQNIGALPEVLANSSKDSVWISHETKWLRSFVKTAVAASKQPRLFGDLLALESVPSTLEPPLRSYFRRVLGGTSEFRRLPNEQLVDVLQRHPNRNLFIGGTVDLESRTLTLTRGNLESLIVPLSIFRRAGSSVPDFKKLEFDDYGYTIRFGPKYEASAHGVLFECDAAYRKEYKKRLQQAEKGFGPSLRRLRLIRGKSRSDFPGISVKTIARLERGESEKPQARTLTKIAKVLDVEPDQIGSY